MESKRLYEKRDYINAIAALEEALARRKLINSPAEIAQLEEDLKAAKAEIASAHDEMWQNQQDVKEMYDPAAERQKEFMAEVDEMFRRRRESEKIAVLIIEPVTAQFRCKIVFPCRGIWNLCLCHSVLKEEEEADEKK